MIRGRKRAESPSSASPKAPIIRFPRLRGRRALQADRDRNASRLDIYHSLLTISWGGFFSVLAGAYMLFNVVFALLYLRQDGSIVNAKPHSFADAFFFSVQTMATIGYGDMHPATFYANAVVTVEVLLGMTG